MYHMAWPVLVLSKSALEPDAMLCLFALMLFAHEAGSPKQGKSAPIMISI